MVDFKKIIEGRIRFSKYFVIFIFILISLVTGSTYAYYAFQEEDSVVIKGNIISINADLDVKLVVGTNEKMIPMQDAALANALKGIGSTNGACIDNVGNLSCQVYQITLTNNGSKLKNLEGSIELYPKEGTGNAYSNLKWRELENPTTIKENSIVNGMSKSLLVSDLTLESKQEKVWYIVVWLSEADYDQYDIDKGEFGGTVTFESGSSSSSNEVNAPNLDNNNLIPVYYDNNQEVWKKADSTNANNSWYNYDNKEWANAVMIKDNTKRATYQTATVGTPITESDISGFLVWIPRYKYRVWNITRQGGPENTYAYSAYTNGIEIEWESGDASTGNVTCSYNVSNNSPATTLSDQCSVNGVTITPSSGNANFTDAWYTHPAFKFNNSNKTGFWIGKFETTGTASSPTVLPDNVALTGQNVSTQFTTSRVFQTYGLSNNVNAHMLTNLEWGAVAYLTHSIYGLCNGTSCRDAYINNSEGVDTGRSAGVLAVDSSSNTYGDYNYKGYQIDSSTGSPTGTKDATLVASSTGNITGVYDISGGAYEYVMANRVDSSNNFNPEDAGNNWNGSTTPNTFYYNPYSYGETNEDQTAFNSAYLGDGTAEATGDTGNYTDAWQPGTGITGSSSLYFGYFYPWFLRGGYCNCTDSGSFHFDSLDGRKNNNVSFRLSIS